MRFATLILLIGIPVVAAAGPIATELQLSEDSVKRDRTLGLTDQMRSINLAPHLFLTTELNNEIPIKSVITTLTDAHFRSTDDAAINKGFGSNPVYGYAVVENNSDTDIWSLKFSYALLDHIEVYIVNNLSHKPSQLHYLGQNGDTFPFLRREIRIPSFTFQVPLARGVPNLIIFKLQTAGARYSEVNLLTSSGLAEAESHITFSLGLYFGGLLVLLVYTFILFLFTRSSAYLIFFGLVSMMTLFFFAEAGLVSQYFSPTDPLWANHLFLLGLSGISLMGFWLNSVFLRKTLSSRERRALLGLMTASGSNFLLSFIFDYSTVARLGLGLIIIFMITTCWLAVRGWIQGYRPAKRYFYAILLMIFGGTIESLRVLGAIPINELSQFGPLAGVAGFIFMMSVALIERMLLQQERARTLFRSFEKFAPASLVRALHQNGEVVGIGGSRKDVTIMFADIEGYSTVVEATEPRIVVELMTEYFDNMQRVIESYGGYILEFAGDGILAVFGTPSPLANHSDSAAKCSIMMQRVVDRLNHRYEANGQIEVFEGAGLRGLAIRIGVHSGNVIAGTLGSRQTLKYGVIGDAVNVAARLESLNKELKSSVLVSETTFSALSPETQSWFEGLGAYPVKGRSEPVPIFRLIEEYLNVETDDPSMSLKSVNAFQWWEQSLDESD